MAELSRSLNETLLEITSIPSPIGEEKALCFSGRSRIFSTQSTETPKFRI